jgi:hypothetical protein
VACGSRGPGRGALFDCNGCSHAHKARIILAQSVKLSILMPVYNERTVVERCIALVLSAPIPEDMERELIIFTAIQYASGDFSLIQEPTSSITPPNTPSCSGLFSTAALTPSNTASRFLAATARYARDVYVRFSATLLPFLYQFHLALDVSQCF